jgi:hypothetical protein
MSSTCAEAITCLKSSAVIYLHPASSCILTCRLLSKHQSNFFTCVTMTYLSPCLLDCFLRAIAIALLPSDGSNVKQRWIGEKLILVRNSVFLQLHSADPTRNTFCACNNLCLQMHGKEILHAVLATHTFYTCCMDQPYVPNLKPT